MTFQANEGRSYILRCALNVIISSLVYRPGILADGVCGRPGRTPLAVHDPGGDSFDAGARIRYNCVHEKDVILGNSERVCLSNGSWSGEMPVCSKLAEIGEARMANEDPDMGASFSIDGNSSTCSGIPGINQTIWEGYLISSSNIFMVRIIIQGKRPRNMEVTVKGDNIPENRCRDDESAADSVKTTTLTFQCSTGTFGNYIFVRSNSQALRICEISVFLSQVQQCLTPDIPRHGYGRLLTSGKKSEYQFNCHAGYKRWGPLSVLCQADGTWSPKSPTCERIYCSPPSKPENGNVEYDLINGRVPYNGTAEYRCNEGFELEGHSRIRCHHWETWDFIAPKCEKKISGILISSKGIQCETHPLVLNGAAILLSNSSSYGSQLLIKCNTGYYSEETTIRRCETSEGWGDLNVCIAIPCGSSTTGLVENGEWIPLNDSRLIQVLVCAEGFHIEGSPPITRCLSNGSWSYTPAVCKNTMEDNMWGNSWSPSLILITSIAVGAGTAISILCMSVAILVFRKRCQSRTNTTVFHLENTMHTGETGEQNSHQKKCQSADEHYQSVIELRPKINCTNPRKLHSALPNLPVEADPVYAQPFENGIVPNKCFTVNVNKKDDLYSAHIYAEPVDSRISATEPSNIPVNLTVLQTRTDDLSSKLKLRSEEILTNSNKQNCDKQCAIYASAYDSSNLDSKNLISIVDNYRRSHDKINLGSFKDNSEYAGFP